MPSDNREKRMSAKSTVIHDVGVHLRDLLRHDLRDDDSDRHGKTPGEACNVEREPHTEKMETDTKRQLRQRRHQDERGHEKIGDCNHTICFSKSGKKRERMIRF